MADDRYHKILAMLVIVQIIASFASIAIWYTQPDMRMTLVVPYADASIVAAIVGVLAIVAFLGVRMHAKWAPVLVIIRSAHQGHQPDGGNCLRNSRRGGRRSGSR